MKRTPLQRKTPLSRKQALRVRTAPKRRKQPPVVTLPSPARKLRAAEPHRIDPALRSLVYDRAGGVCDLCGQRLGRKGWAAHHRQLRSQGGPDTAENLIAVHHFCHTERIHRCPAWARGCGFIVASYDDPGATAVFRHLRRWQQPTGAEWVGATAPDVVTAVSVDRSGPNMAGPVSGYPGTGQDGFSGFESEAS